MANEVSGQPFSLLQPVARLLEAATQENNYDLLINVLSLLCILTILNRGQFTLSQPISVAPASLPSAAPQTPNALLQKTLAELSKAEGGNTSEILATLLPLLNSPQAKSKLNPASIASILSLINSLNTNNSDKAGAGKTTQSDKSQTDASGEPPAAPAASLTDTSLASANLPQQSGSKRSLNWQHSF